MHANSCLLKNLETNESLALFFSAVQDAHPLPADTATLQRFLAGVTLLPCSSQTWRSTTAPLQAPALCWTPTATIHFLPSEHEIEAVLSDGAAMLSVR